MRTKLAQTLDDRINLRLSKEMVKDLEKMAKRRGLVKISDMVRMILHKAIEKDAAK